MRHSATRSSCRPGRDLARGVCIYESVGRVVPGLSNRAGRRFDATCCSTAGDSVERNDVVHRGTFRVRGDVVEVFPAYEEQRAVRIEFWGDEIERISEIDPLRGKSLGELDRYGIYPGSHFVTPLEQRRVAMASIREELGVRLEELQRENKLLERQRLEQRSLYDLEMLEQMGFCHGIENYSRHFSNRAPGDRRRRSSTLPEDFLLVIDESHQTVPQIGAMFRGDRARKEVLVARVPAASPRPAR